MSSNEFKTFLEQYPSYKNTEAIDTLRKKEYARLDAGEHIYLDYTGGSICQSRRFKSITNFCTKMCTATRTPPTPRRKPPRIWLKARANTFSNFSTPIQMNISQFLLPMPAAR